MRALWRNLEKEGRTYLKPKSLNQDPLENFFGQIRSHGVRYTNPNCFSFISSYRTLIINNFFSVHSPGTNCEMDPNVALDNLNNLLLCKQEQTSTTTNFKVVLPINVTSNNNLSHLGRCVVKYVAGFVLKKMLKLINCKKCRKDLLSGTDDYNFMIDAKKIHPNALITPGAKVNSYFCFFICKLNKYLEENCSQSNIKANVILYLTQYDIPLGCELHTDSLKNMFVKYISYYYLQIWIKNINKTLKGKDENADKKKYNKIRILASTRYIKYKKSRSKLNK